MPAAMLSTMMEAMIRVPRIQALPWHTRVYGNPFAPVAHTMIVTSIREKCHCVEPLKLMVARGVRGGDRAEALSQFQERHGERIVGDWHAAIEPGGQEEFETPELFPHTTPVPRR